MDALTKNVSNYVKERGISVSQMARKTGIPYGALYDSLLHSERDRELRANELIAICNYIGVDPMFFADKDAS